MYVAPIPLEPIAIWSTTLDCWLASDDATESLFSVPSAVFSETFPISGMWAGGTAYALPTSELPTGDSACLSSPTLLGTPTSRDWKDGSPQANVPVNGLLGRMVWERCSTPPEPRTAQRVDQISEDPPETSCSRVPL